MKSFVTKVSVGEFMGEGEGKSKKISKKNAAIAVLEELKKLPPLPTVEKMKPRIKKKTKSIVKVSRTHGCCRSKTRELCGSKKQRSPSCTFASRSSLHEMNRASIQTANSINGSDEMSSDLTEAWQKTLLSSCS